MNHSGTWHAKGEIFLQEEGGNSNIKLSVCILPRKKRHSRSKLKLFYAEFDSFKPQATRMVIKNCITRVISLFVFYENRKSHVFKLFGVVINCILENHVCIDCLCLQEEKKLSMLHKIFEDDLYDELSGIVSNGMVLKIVFCHGYVR